MGKSFIMIKESRANANGTNWEKQYIHEWNSLFCRSITKDNYSLLHGD